MTLRKHSPEHDFWHRALEGEIRNVLRDHPAWFNIRDDEDAKRIVNSIAKRVVGKVIATNKAREQARGSMRA